jgi:hypothetical protein
MKTINGWDSIEPEIGFRQGLVYRNQQSVEKLNQLLGTCFVDLCAESKNVESICKNMIKLNYEPFKEVSDKDSGVGRCNLTTEIRVIDQMLYNCKSNEIDLNFKGFQVSVFYLSGYGFYKGGHTLLLVPDSEDPAYF